MRVVRLGHPAATALPGVGHVPAPGEVDVQKTGAFGGRRLDPAVRHVRAADEVEVQEVEASGGDRLDPAVRHVRAAGD